MGCPATIVPFVHFVRSSVVRNQPAATAAVWIYKMM